MSDHLSTAEVGRVVTRAVAAKSGRGSNVNLPDHGSVNSMVTPKRKSTLGPISKVPTVQLPPFYYLAHFHLPTFLTKKTTKNAVEKSVVWRVWKCRYCANGEVRGQKCDGRQHKNHLDCCDDFKALVLGNWPTYQEVVYSAPPRSAVLKPSHENQNHQDDPMIPSAPPPGSTQSPPSPEQRIAPATVPKVLPPPPPPITATSSSHSHSCFSGTPSTQTDSSPPTSSTNNGCLSPPTSQVSSNAPLPFRSTSPPASHQFPTKSAELPRTKDLIPSSHPASLVTQPLLDFPGEIPSSLVDPSVQLGTTDGSAQPNSPESKTEPELPSTLLVSSPTTSSVKISHPTSQAKVPIADPNLITSSQHLVGMIVEMQKTIRDLKDDLDDQNREVVMLRECVKELREKDKKKNDEEEVVIPNSAVAERKSDDDAAAMQHLPHPPTDSVPEPAEYSASDTSPTSSSDVGLTMEDLIKLDFYRAEMIKVLWEMISEQQEDVAKMRKEACQSDNALLFLIDENAQRKAEMLALLKLMTTDVIRGALEHPSQLVQSEDTIGTTTLESSVTNLSVEDSALDTTYYPADTEEEEREHTQSDQEARTGYISSDGDTSEAMFCQALRSDMDIPFEMAQHFGAPGGDFCPKSASDFSSDF